MTTKQRLVWTIDLADDAEAIAAYDHAHAPGNTPAEVLDSQRRNGIGELSIHRHGNRLVMILDPAEDFDPERLDQETRTEPALVAWQQRMSALQRPLPGESGWALMACVFRQSDHP